MSARVEGGWLDGHAIRKARKPFRCDGHEAHPTDEKRKGAHCQRIINPGDFYVEGEMNPYRAGGYGFDRYCGYCATAGKEAKSAIDAQNAITKACG